MLVLRCKLQTKPEIPSHQKASLSNNIVCFWPSDLTFLNPSSVKWGNSVSVHKGYWKRDIDRGFSTALSMLEVEQASFWAAQHLSLLLLGGPFIHPLLSIVL